MTETEQSCYYDGLQYRTPEAAAKARAFAEKVAARKADTTTKPEAKKTPHVSEIDKRDRAMATYHAGQEGGY